MLLKTETYQQQSSLAGYCRDGIETKLLGARQDRLHNYRRLVFNVVKDALETTYPIAFQYIDEIIWNDMVYHFFSSHKCTHPQVWRMPFEFYQFCVTNNYSQKYKLPFLNNLLLFEWLEVELYMMEDKEYPGFYSTDELLNQKVAINPEHKLIKLEYPVHMDQPFDTVDKKGDYFLLLYREKDTGKVQFTNLSVLFAFMVENFAIGEKTLEQILNDILFIFGINDLGLLQKESFKFLEDLKTRGFVLGALR